MGTEIGWSTDSAVSRVLSLSREWLVGEDVGGEDVVKEDLLTVTEGHLKGRLSF